MIATQCEFSQTAAWVEAFGAIAAVIGAGWVAARDSRATRRREEQNEMRALKKEEKADRLTREAALNLAILAHTQIHNLHVLLKDEEWRGRVARVSASRALLTTERMLIAFPIQSLGNAPAMVEFSRFPASLATAAEIYTNLETAVRATKTNDRAVIFDEYNKQMERLDDSVELQLSKLKKSLRSGEDS